MDSDSAPEPQPVTNPYAAPESAPLMSEVPSLKDKGYRTSLINRRTTAVAIELTLWGITGAPIVRALILAAGLEPKSWGGTLLMSVFYYVLRDLIGLSAVGRYLLGLRLVADGAADMTAAPVRARLLRNAVFALPFVMILIEYFMAMYDAQMQRLGDHIANTRVVDLDPARSRRSSYSWQMLVALAVMVTVGLKVSQMITAVMSGIR